MEAVMSGLSRLSLAHQVTFCTAKTQHCKDNDATKRFILGLDYDQHSDRLVMSSAEERLLVYRTSGLTLSETLFHKGSSGLSHPRFGPCHPNHVYAVSYDGALMMWDLRAVNKIPVAFTSKSLNPLGLNFLSFDVNCDERLLAVGSSVSENGDAFLGFWDSRMVGDAFVGVYEDCHSDNINALTFHPTRPEALLSGSEDGLLCQFDLEAEDEEDALILTCNSDRSVARVGWGDEGIMYCVSDMDTFHAWTSDGDVSIEVTELPKGWTDLVDSVMSPLLLLGDQEGNICLWDAKKNSVEAKMTGGHCEVVRCVARLSEGRLVTGGEDGRLCCWQSTEEKVGKAEKRHRGKDSSKEKAKKKKKG